MKIPIDKDQVNTWTEFFQHDQWNYFDKIQKIANLYPEEQSLEVDYWHIHKWNDEFAESFLNRPRGMIPNAEKAISDLTPADVDAHLYFRVYNIPNETARVSLEKLRTEHIEKYVAVEGIVQSRTKVSPRIISATFKCQKCGYNMTVPQDDTRLKEPFKCANENCDREATKNTSFELIKTMSDFDDLQVINIQEPLGKNSKPAPPHTLRIYVHNDLCGRVNPGEHIIVNGVLFASQKKADTGKSTDFDLFLDGFSIESDEITFEEIEITEEDKVEIIKLSKHPKIHTLIRDSIAPHIFEMDIEKDALALQLFGGVGESTEAFHHRGDIHILLIGDPGTGKSELLRAVAYISPRGEFTSGRGATEAGLTATAVKDEYDGRWILVAGVMVLANKGIMCADEIDKMRKTDRTAMHPGMEQQNVPINKGGINTTLPTECAVLAAANPKKGRFTDDETYLSQINLLPTLLSRFDLIFPIIDKSDPDKDRTLARQILRGRREGAQRLNDIPLDKPTGIPKETIKLDLLRKYIAYAKRNIIPIMNREVEDYLLDYYVTQRTNNGSMNEECEVVERRTITARQLEGLVRLSQASARLRLSKEVILEDGKRATTLFSEYMNQVAKDSSGNLDIDMIMSGTTAKKINHASIVIEAIHDAIKTKEVDTSMGVDIQFIIDYSESQGMSESDVDKCIKIMLTNGRLYVPTEGHYRDVK